MIMRKFYILLLSSFAIHLCNGQVGIGTLNPNSSSQLDIVSESKGVLIPRVALKGAADATTITNGNINGLLVFNTETTADTEPGFYYWYIDKWVRIGSVKSASLTNSLTYSNNKITSIVNEQSATAQVVNSVTTTLNGRDLITTVNGLNSNTLDLTPILNDYVTAANGLSSKDTKIELGGALVKPTIIATTPSNTLALSGLQTGNNTYAFNGDTYSSNSDKILVSDAATGVIRQVRSAMPKFFYAPSVTVPTRDPSGQLLTGTRTLDVYNLYLQQFGYTKGVGQARSNNASSLPTLSSADLDYFVTYYDIDIFETVSISVSGVITYTIKPGAVVTENSFMNIVFKVKD